jgi:NAD(P)-dependent dehydrogenase (short-subunit alcohol dehydrogenase family)
VTGGAHRLGRSVVLELASRGADVAIHYNQSAAAALATARCAAGYGARTTIVQADAADEAAVAAMVDQVVADLGPVDILVACAGVFRRTPLADARTRDWQDMMRGNFDTFRNCADKLAPAMAARGRGAIVAFGDVAALRPWADYIPYCTAKARVLAHARTLSRRLAPAVRVNSVLPGPVLFPSDYPAEARHREVERTLLGRAGQPEDVARAVAFLLENDYLTGVELPIDGGRLLV